MGLSCAMAVRDVFGTDSDVIADLKQAGPQSGTMEPGHPPCAKEDEKRMRRIIDWADEAVNFLGINSAIE